MDKHNNISTNLQKYQQNFSLFIRKNANKKYHAKHLPQKNLHIYSALIFNNINAVLKTCFPICYSISEHTYWDNLVHIFIEEYKCESPMFKDIPEQFLEWLNKANHKIKNSLPIFFIDFAHYEWVEMAIAIAPDNIDSKNINKMLSSYIT